MSQLKPGDGAPDFEAPDQDEAMVKRDDFAGRKLFIFFYPKADTSG